MLERFETLSSSNSRLEQLSQDNASLANDFVDAWVSRRLDGRTIVSVLGNSENDDALATSISADIKRGNGAYVRVTVNQQDFGLNSDETKAALEAVVAQVEGEDYQLTLAKRLAQEWTYNYLLTADNTPQPGDSEVAEFDYRPAATADTAVDQANGNLTIKGLNPNPQTPFQMEFFKRYALTRVLLSLGVINVTCDYSPLLEHQNPTLPAEQEAALRLAQAWKLPYAANGLVNGLTTKVGNDIRVSQMAMSLTLEFNNLGNNNSLPYPEWLRLNLVQSAAGEESLPNYYVLLVQSDAAAGDVAAAAATAGLSCLTSPNTTIGKYSLLVLLTGGQAGIYGSDRPTEARYPQLPDDPTGKAAFALNLPSPSEPTEPAQGETEQGEAVQGENAQGEPAQDEFA
jgi:hypothetical protein